MSVNDSWHVVLIVTASDRDRLQSPTSQTAGTSQEVSYFYFTMMLLFHS